MYQTIGEIGGMGEHSERTLRYKKMWNVRLHPLGAHLVSLLFKSTQPCAFKCPHSQFPGRNFFFVSNPKNLDMIWLCVSIALSALHSTVPTVHVCTTTSVI